MVVIPAAVVDAINDPSSLKALGTLDKKGIMNVVVVGTLCAPNEETIAFADIMFGKTKQNLESTKRATALIFRPAMEGYQVKGSFKGWETSGPLFDELNAKVKAMLGANTQVKGVGTMKAMEVYSIAPAIGKKMV